MSAARQEKDRISTRVSTDVRSKLSEAADLTGSTLSQFLLAAAVKEANQVIEHERVVRLDLESTKCFLNVLDNAPEPVEGLIELFENNRQ